MLRVSPSLPKESLLPASEIFLKKKVRKCTHHSCHAVDDHHDVEDDDQEVEDGYLTQLVFGSTDHATGRFLPVLISNLQGPQQSLSLGTIPID